MSEEEAMDRYLSDLAHNDARQRANILDFSVPLIPPSVNHYKLPRHDGGFYRVPECRAYMDAVAIFSKRIVAGKPWGQPLEGFYYEVEIGFMILEENFLRVDVDNLLKVAIDSLKHCGIIRDDRYIIHLMASKIAVCERARERTMYKLFGIEKG